MWEATRSVLDDGVGSSGRRSPEDRHVGRRGGWPSDEGKGMRDGGMTVERWFTSSEADSPEFEAAHKGSEVQRVAPPVACACHVE